MHEIKGFLIMGKISSWKDRHGIRTVKIDLLLKFSLFAMRIETIKIVILHHYEVIEDFSRSWLLFQTTTNQH